jgi:hypothetical protein
MTLPGAEVVNVRLELLITVGVSRLSEFVVVQISLVEDGNETVIVAALLIKCRLLHKTLQCD